MLLIHCFSPESLRRHSFGLRRFLALHALVCLLSYSSAQTGLERFAQYGSHETPVEPRYLDKQTVASHASAGGTGISLPLVDCEYASGFDGLTCDKEGYFVSGFEHEGQWLTGGGRVPLSRALCCRIGLPDGMPELDGGQAKPTNVVSISCHEPHGKLLQTLQCEASGASFVSGFPRTVPVSRGPSFYPLGPLACCTPAILLSNGDLWSTERCGCMDYPHVNCDPEPGKNRTRLLAGFDQARESHAREAVPVAPAKCCQTCLGSKILDNACADLNKCSGHGRCVFAACECDPGWTGPECASRSRGEADSSSWEFAVLLVGGLGILVSLCVLSWHIYVLYTRPSPEVMEEEMQEALLLRMHEDGGSVGSEDTSDDEDSADEGELQEEEEQGPEEEAQDGRLLLNINEIVSVERDATRAAELPQGVDEAAVELESVAEEEEEGPVELPHGAEEREMVEMTSMQNPHENSDCCSDDDMAVLDEGYGDCNICFSRPIQVVVVPCGHACMCRRCARRLNRCPICRVEIVRRQKLFMGK